MNIKNLMIAGALLVLAVIFSNCGGSGPTDPPDGCEPNCPQTQIIFTDPIMGLAITEGEVIVCDSIVEILNGGSGLQPQWWLKGDNEWMKARGDSIPSFCNQSDDILRVLFANSPVMPPAGNYVVTVHARVWVYPNPPGRIEATENRPIHILSRED